MALFEFNVPDDIIGLVWVTKDDRGTTAQWFSVLSINGELLVPAERRTVARSLRSLAVKLDAEAAALENSS